MSHHWHPSETAQTSTGKMSQMKELQYITLKIYWQWECVTSHILASSEQSNTLQSFLESSKLIVLKNNKL
uniref:Uncharacterized protein n=1 Tax=Anguilla anguilla TaxID=7936 RepID=A0A0E9X9J4_ANGAN